MQVDLEELQTYIDAGLINGQHHPTMPLKIYNYSKTCQYRGDWNKYTMMCRGLILDDEGTVVALPFKKFFNYQEHVAEDSKLPPLPISQSYRIHEKLDGSLIICVNYHSEMVVASRGSFTSDQATKAKEIFAQKYPDWRPTLDETWLFEIIYPSNRIVVDYHDTEDLVHLATLRTKTGEADPLGYVDWPGPHAKTFDSKSFSDLLAHKEDNVEGFVVEFYPSGVRCKIKTEEYVRLHRIVTGVTSKMVWENLRDGKPMGDLLENVPDEFYDWLTGMINNLTGLYQAIELRSMSDLRQVPAGTRKEQAEFIKTCTYPGIVFAMLDGKSYDQQIWKMVKPAHSTPFKEEA